MKPKKLVAVVVAIVLALTVFSLVGCSTTTTTEQASEETTITEETSTADTTTEDTTTEETKPKVAFICKGMSDTYCVSVMNAFKNLAESDEYKDQFTVDYLDGQRDITIINNLIETCTASGYDAIVFQQEDAEAPVNVVKQALDQGIYVVVTTGHIDDDGASWFVDADPQDQGRTLAQYAADSGALDNAKIGILRGTAGNFHADGRYAGFLEVIEAKEDAEILDSQIPEGWAQDKAMTIVQGWLVALPDMNVIFASCDAEAFGALGAIELAGMEDQVKVFSIDATIDGMQAVKDGRIMAEVMQNPTEYAEDALVIVSKLLAGESAESTNISSILITPDNVDEYLEAAEVEQAH